MGKKRCLIVAGIVVAAAALISILFCVVLANHRPVIASLEAEPERVLPRGTCQIACNATDPDGDGLVYGWSATEGTITTTGRGDTVAWSAPNAVGSYNVTVIVADGRGGAATDYITVTVRSDRSPTINSLTASADWALPAGSLHVTCSASDPDGDELSYEWSSSGGDVSGIGAAVEWTGPEELGIYYITVIVSDGHGRSDTRTLPASVAPEQPPIIEDLEITKDRYGHCYLKEYSGGYYVGKGQTYDIECIVSDAGVELLHEWSCDGGELSGEGSLVVWTAPNTNVYVTVTVIVSDMTGNMAGKNIVLNVVSCSTCTFGSCSAG